MKRTRSRRGKNNADVDTRVVSLVAQRYMGPIMKNNPTDTSQVVTNLTYTTTQSSSGIGTIEFGMHTGTSASIYIGVNACTDWGSFTNIYSEYRVLGMCLEYVNFYNRSYSTVYTSRALVGAAFHDATVLGSGQALDNIIQNPNYKKADSLSSLKVEWKMSEPGEADFIPTNAPVVRGFIQDVSVGNAASLAYGQVYCTWLIQFHGRQ